MKTAKNSLQNRKHHKSGHLTWKRVNGDGLKDVVIGAYGYNNYRGSAYVVLGSPTIGASLAMASLGSTQGYTVTGGGTGEVLGAFVGGGKDFNGDGLSDVIIGGSGWSASQGSLYVLYGKQASSFSQVDVSLGLAADQGLAIRGEQAGDGFGGYAAMLEDVNLDGMNDLIVGAIESNGQRGSAYLLYVPCKWLLKLNFNVLNRGMSRKLFSVLQSDKLHDM